MTNHFVGRVEEVVINAESNDARFERFCIEAVSEAEGGVAIVGTSASWDLGRDGVGIGRGSGIFLCTSLRDDVDAKVMSDLDRITSTTKGLKELYFCSSQSLSEHRITQIQKAMLEHIDFAFGIHVLGAIQLAELGRRGQNPLRRHYGADIDDVIQRIDISPDDTAELAGLRLALLASGAEESVAIRKDVYTSAILDAMPDSGAITTANIAKEISASLRLGHSLHQSALLPYLAALRDSGLITKAGELHVLTEAGMKAIEDRKIAGASTLINGRNAVRATLEESIGAKIIDDEFRRIWEVFEVRMAHYFNSRGEEITREIGVLLIESDNQYSDDTSLVSSLSFLDDLCSAVAATSAHPQRQQELHQAVRDLFSDRTGDASKWLVQVCAAYVTACMLGLEQRSSEAVKALLRRTRLILDSDVLLSLLGEDEPDHDAVQAIVQRWTRIGGKVLAATPVLQEVAYHASIAERDYEQVSKFLPGNASQRVHLVENVFVRSFASMVEEGRASRGMWKEYIRQYRGKSEYDISSVVGYIIHEHAIGRLPERDADDAERVRQVYEFILELMEHESLRVDKKTRDKAIRDAELYVSMTSYSAKLRQTDPGATCLLISSARRLVAVDREFEQSGESSLVISVAAAAYLVSLLPGVNLGLSAMRSFLFDESRSRFSSELERTVLRMIHGSASRAMPFGKRGILMREVRSRLLSNAKFSEDGVKKSLDEVERAAVREEGRASLIDVLTKSLDAVAVDSKAEIENRELKRKIADLERENDRLRRKR